MIHKYCSCCGARTTEKVPANDNRIRVVCETCNTIHYENPILVAGCIVEQDDHLLFCRRNIEPQRGKWTLPAGYVENNETAAQAALRETMEESGAEVEMLGAYRFFDLPALNQFYVLFRARLLTCPFVPTTESSEVKLFHLNDIPWQQIAFPVITATLQHYSKDLLNSSFSFKNKTIAP